MYKNTPVKFIKYFLIFVKDDNIISENIMAPNQPVLSNLQIELLKLYSNGISDKHLLEIKWILVQYFADKATEAMDKVWEENNLSKEDMINWTNEHNRRKSSH